MKLQNFELKNVQRKSRISADLLWEDCDRPALNLFFETEEEYGTALADNIEPFLVGCLLPALHYKEKRISVEGSICPDLKQNLNIAMNLIRHWYYEPTHRLVTIEESNGSALRRYPHTESTGFFFSGGIDCLATLHVNRSVYPQGHPAAIKYGLLIYGQNIESDDRPETFHSAFDELDEITRESNVRLIPIHTNIRMVDDSSYMFKINHGAILGSVAHSLSNLLMRVYISASDSIPTLRLIGQHNFKPHGSHPLLDPLYSSYNLSVKHDGIELSRLDKTRLIAHWDTALRHIKVCGPNWPGVNCCRCEKCVRTMLELMAAGVLHKSAAFEKDDVTAEMVSNITIKKPEFGYSVDDDYLELIEPLKQLGRQDLVRAILSMIDRSHYPAKSLKQKIRRIDAKYLDHSLSRIKRKLMNP